MWEPIKSAACPLTCTNNALLDLSLCRSCISSHQRSKGFKLCCAPSFLGTGYFSFSSGQQCKDFCSCHGEGTFLGHLEMQNNAPVWECKSLALRRRRLYNHRCRESTHSQSGNAVALQREEPPGFATTPNICDLAFPSGNFIQGAVHS